MSASATFAPMRRKNWASSQPTAPAPRMTMLAGISRTVVASRFVQ